MTDVSGLDCAAVPFCPASAEVLSVLGDVPGVTGAAGSTSAGAAAGSLTRPFVLSVRIDDHLSTHMRTLKLSEFQVSMRMHAQFGVQQW